MRLAGRLGVVRDHDDGLVELAVEPVEQVEDLVGAPEPTTSAICGFLGVGFEPAMLEPQRDRRERMTDGVHPESRMIGDMKFHTHTRIDASVADRWKSTLGDDDLSDEARALAAAFGYEAPARPRGARTEFEL